MVMVLKTIKEKIVSAFHVADEVMRGKAVETIEYEVGELDNIFAIPGIGRFHWDTVSAHTYHDGAFTGNGGRLGDYARKSFNSP